jgi:ferrochelatase
VAAPTGIVLCNMGGPDSLDGVEPFLRQLFSDPALIQLPLGFLWQKAFAKLVARRRAPRVRELYRSIGGRSPLGELTARQAAALEAELTRRGHECRCVVAMSYSAPFAAHAAAQLRQSGITRVVGLTLYPQYSRATTGSALRGLRRALEVAGGGFLYTEIDRYFDDPAYLDAVAGTVSRALAAVPGDAPVLFSAHGLPQRYVDRGDPYEREVNATVAGVVARLGLEGRFRLGFQSRVGPIKWLEPATDTVIRALGAGGATALVCVPVAFVSDHLETLQEIDLLYRDLAREVGITAFSRAPALNDDPAFITALAGLVQRHLETGDARAHGGPAAPPAAPGSGARATLGAA